MCPSTWTTRKKPKPEETLSDYEKVDLVLRRITKLSMTLGELLYHLFSWPAKKPPDPKSSGKTNLLCPAEKHTMLVMAFLRSWGNHKAVDIVKLIYHHLFAKPLRKDPERDLGFLSTQPPKGTKHACPAIASWFFQRVTKECQLQIRALASKSSGLHMWVTHHNRVHVDPNMVPSWTKIHRINRDGSWMEKLLMEKAPVMWCLVKGMLDSSCWRRKTEHKDIRRPTTPVCTLIDFLLRALTPFYR
jgi:hypothetical protein